MDDAEDLFFRQCRDFVDEQSSGEWDDVTVVADARSLMAFIDKIRPARPKLGTEVTPEIVAMLDGSAAREDEVWKVAQLAATIVAARNVGSFPNSAVRDARSILAEARRQTSEDSPDER